VQWHYEFHGVGYVRTPLGGWAQNGVAVLEDQLSGGAMIFVRGQDDTVEYIERSADGAWSPWRSIGGSVTSKPAVVQRLNGGLVVLARWADGTMRERTRSHTGVWSPTWTSVDIELVGGPVFRDKIYRGKIKVLFTGVDHRLWSATREHKGDWVNTRAAPRLPGGRRVVSGPGLSLYATSVPAPIVRSSHEGAAWQLTDTWHSLGGTFRRRVGFDTAYWGDGVGSTTYVYGRWADGRLVVKENGEDWAPVEPAI
jgi:hypothetical protein